MGLHQKKAFDLNTAYFAAENVDFYVLQRTCAGMVGICDVSSVNPPVIASARSFFDILFLVLIFFTESADEKHPCHCDCERVSVS